MHMNIMINEDMITYYGIVILPLTISQTFRATISTTSIRYQSQLVSGGSFSNTLAIGGNTLAIGGSSI